MSQAQWLMRTRNGSESDILLVTLCREEKKKGSIVHMAILKDVPPSLRLHPIVFHMLTLGLGHIPIWIDGCSID